MKTNQKTIFLYTILAGLALRIYLILKLPAWYDEFTTIKIINQSFSDIVTLLSDPAHLPGYYIFIKLWAYISPNIIWLRSSSIMFFLTNAVLFYKLGEKIKSPAFGLILTIFYSFSGYFLIFDWQLRNYSGLVTFILSSYLLYNEELVGNKKIAFFLVNLVGLFYDYGFLFYILPLIFISLIKFIITKTESKIKLSILLAGLGIYLLAWSKTFVSMFGASINALDWVSNFTSPGFVVPFFFGSFSNVFYSIVFLVLFLLGLYEFFINSNSISKTFVTISTISLSGSALITKLFFPFLHLRILQVVAMSVTIFFGYGFVLLWRTSKILAISIIIIFIVNTLHIITNLPSYPGEYLITFISE